jgi:RNA polymerase sigma factor (TIGR02999 family)
VSAQATSRSGAHGAGAPRERSTDAQNAAMSAANDPSVPASADDASRATPSLLEPAPSDALFSALYSELHRLARREAARAGPGAVVSPTTLLHEAYLDMSQRDSLAFPDRGRFLAYAARAMRAVAIDRARADGAQKRGGGLDITSLDTETAESVADPGMLSDIGAALDDLATLEPALANVVDLKFFCGFSVAEIAALQGVSERTVQRQWEKARLLLYRALGAGA